MDEATFLTAYVEELCDGMEGCCGAAALPFDRSACEAVTAGRFDIQQGPGHLFDPERGRL